MENLEKVVKQNSLWCTLIAVGITAEALLENSPKKADRGSESSGHRRPRVLSLLRLCHHSECRQQALPVSESGLHEGVMQTVQGDLARAASLR